MKNINFRRGNRNVTFVALRENRELCHKTDIILSYKHATVNNVMV